MGYLVVVFAVRELDEFGVPFVAPRFLRVPDYRGWWRGALFQPILVHVPQSLSELNATSDAEIVTMDELKEKSFVMMSASSPE